MYIVFFIPNNNIGLGFCMYSLFFYRVNIKKTTIFEKKSNYCSFRVLN